MFLTSRSKNFKVFMIERKKSKASNHSIEATRTHAPNCFKNVIKRNIAYKDKDRFSVRPLKKEIYLSKV